MYNQVMVDCGDMMSGATVVECDHNCRKLITNSKWTVADTTCNGMAIVHLRYITHTKTGVKVLLVKLCQLCSGILGHAQHTTE